jgi:hypothetical protein
MTQNQYGTGTTSTGPLPSKTPVIPGPLQPADLDPFVPTFNAVRDILRRHRMSDSLDHTAALITLKVCADMWRIVKDQIPELGNDD